MAATSFVGLGALLILGLSLASIITGVVLLVMHYRRPGGGEGNQCGRCGYPVRGVSTLNCPECGADLREVGIASIRRGGVVLPWVLIGVGLLVSTTCICGGLFGVRSVSHTVVMPAPSPAPIPAPQPLPPTTPPTAP
mgnify:CR=1 FL=1